MKKVIRILSILLVIIILFTFSVSAVYTVDGFENILISDTIKNDGVWFYELNKKDKTAKICGYNGKDKDVVIPEIIEGEYKVTELVLNTPDMYSIAFPVFGTQANFETLSLPKTLKLITNYFPSEYYEHEHSATSASKEYRLMKEGKLEHNGQVIMRGFFDSEPLHNLKAFIVDEKNQYFSSEDGVLYNKDQSILIQYPWGKSQKKFVIPETVTQIMPYAVSGYAGIEEIVINKNVKILGQMCIGDAATYQRNSSSREHYLKIPVTANRPNITILNNSLEEGQLSNLFCHSGIGDSKFKITVYKDSPADKYFSTKRTYITVVERIANPYVKDQPEKPNSSTNTPSKKTTAESKDTTSKKDTVKDNSSKTESVVSKPTESVITETTESGEILTIGATEKNTDNATETKPEKSNKIWIIVVIAAVVLLAGGGTAYFIIKSKKIN